MVSPKQFFPEREPRAPQGLMPLLKRGEEMVWWRPLIIPFRPLVVIFNLILRSRGDSTVLRSGGTPPPQLISTNEERWKVVRDESGRISEIIVHRKVEAA